MAKKSRQSIATPANTPIDFKVDPATGVGYISQRKAAELCGVSRNAVVHFCSGKFDISQGLSDEQLSFVVHHYAKQKRAQAIDTLFLFAHAGARAFIYSQAHYNPFPANADLTVHNDLMFKINIPERWVVEVIQRSQASVRRSLSMAIKRSVGSALEKHYLWRNGERWYSAWFLANAPFAKEDGMAFKNTLTKLAETLGLESEIKQFLLPA